MNTFAIAYLNFCDDINKIALINASSELEAMEIFAKDYLDFQTIDCSDLGITNIKNFLYDFCDMSVSNPVMIS